MSDQVERLINALPHWSQIVDDYIVPGIPVNLAVSLDPEVTIFIDSAAAKIGARIAYEKGDTVPSSTLRSLSISRVSIQGRVFLEIATTVRDLYPNFYFLMTEVISQITQHQSSPAVAIEKTLKKWEELLRQAEILTTEQQTGLFGELWLLRRLIGAFGPGSIRSWVGPKNEVHDFRSEAIEFEVKTTLRSRRQHRINGLSQLVPSPGCILWILSLRLIDAGSSGVSLPELVAAIRSDLLHNSDSVEAFGACLAESKYFDHDARHYPARRRLADEAVLIRVEDGVPRLTPETLHATDPRFGPARIQEVSYVVDLTDLGIRDESSEFFAILPSSNLSKEA